MIIKYLPNPNYFKLFAAAVLFYIAVKMIREQTKKKSANGDNANGEIRFQEMVRRQHAKTTGSELKNTIFPNVRGYPF